MHGVRKTYSPPGAVLAVAPVLCLPLVLALPAAGVSGVGGTGGMGAVVMAAGFLAGGRLGPAGAEGRFALARGFSSLGPREGGEAGAFGFVGVAGGVEAPSTEGACGGVASVGENRSDSSPHGSQVAMESNSVCLPWMGSSPDGVSEVDVDGDLLVSAWIKASRSTAEPSFPLLEACEAMMAAAVVNRIKINKNRDLRMLGIYCCVR